MILDGDHQRAVEGRREARKPHRLHRPQPAEEKIASKGFESCWRGCRLTDCNAAAMRGDERTVTDTRDNIPPSSSARGRSARARRWSPRISSAARRCSCSARRRCCSCRRGRAAARRASMPAASSLRPRDGDAHRHRRRRRQGGRDRRGRRQRPCSRPTPSAAGSTTSRSGRDGAVAWSAGKRRSCAPARARSACSSCRRPSAALAFAPKGLRLAHRALQRRRRCGFPSQAAPERSNGRARISASPSARTADSWSPPCRSRCCMAGGSPTQGHAHVGLCRARALARLDRRAASGSRPPARTQLILWPFQARTGRWARSRACWRRSRRRSRSSPAIPSRRWSRSATRTGWCCWCASRTAPKSWRRKPGDAPVTALAWSARRDARVRHRGRRGRRSSDLG